LWLTDCIRRRKEADITLQSRFKICGK
jgi:hypothetical protein